MSAHAAGNALPAPPMSALTPSRDLQLLLRVDVLHFGRLVVGFGLRIAVAVVCFSVRYVDFLCRKCVQCARQGGIFRRAWIQG